MKIYLTFIMMNFLHNRECSFNKILSVVYPFKETSNCINNFKFKFMTIFYASKLNLPTKLKASFPLKEISQ